VTPTFACFKGVRGSKLGLPFSDIRAVCLAGGFGHIDSLDSIEVNIIHHPV